MLCTTIDEELPPIYAKQTRQIYTENFLCAIVARANYNGLVYTVSEGDMRRLRLTRHVVTSLTTSFHNPGINLTTECFSSVALADDLIRKQITLLGTLRKKQTIYPQRICH